MTRREPVTRRSREGARRSRRRRRHQRHGRDHGGEGEAARDHIERVVSDRVAEDQDAAGDRGAVRGHGGERDHRDRLARLQPASQAEEGADAGDQRHQRPGADDAQRVARDGPGERLHRDVGDPQQQPGGDAEQRRRWSGRERARASGEEQQQRRSRRRRPRRRSSPRSSSSRCRPPACHRVTARSARPTAHRPQAQPLAGPDADAEPALGQPGQQHQAAGDRRLDQRERRDGQRGDVQGPGADGDREADRPPAGAKQRRRAPQRAGCSRTAGRRHGAPVLAEHRHVGGQSACEREHVPS